ncbi:hypothetical protein LENED_009732 [Lentinula edodes]|uniref:Uncharacterized protein n=1 Tax=Lentinula edodes TaxID=5353 RepID=A0A1Q3EKK6_LENED|nr:hypothetical protein LENED_009732 [Lentinula edodes]
MWYLDLFLWVLERDSKLPTNRPVYGMTSARRTVICKEKAYLFQHLHVFDLTTEKLMHPLIGPLITFRTALLDDKMYVFGEEDYGRSLGSNILMVLNLFTSTWKQLTEMFQQSPT